MKLKDFLVKKYNNYYIKNQCTEDEIEKILKFYTCFDGYRTPYSCAQVTGFDEKKCTRVENYLLERRSIGSYYFEANCPPQKYMRRYILEKFADINETSSILEIGPGDNPLFNEEKYCKWIGLDKGYVETEYGGVIKFHEYDWGKGKYKKLHEGSWETISMDCSKISGTPSEFDLVCGSHSFEHTPRPITALQEAGKVLKKGGKLVLFVPDGYSLNPSNKDFTHTIYLVPEMIEEFFKYAGCFEQIEYEVFRPNLDLVITAIRK